MLAQVQDLHAVTPASFLEVSGAILHGLSLQQARNNSAACGQVQLKADMLPWQPAHVAGS